MPQTSANQAAGKDREDRTEPSNSLALLTNLDAELSIASISYNNLMIGPGRVIVKGTGVRLEAKLEPTVIAGGRVRFDSDPRAAGQTDATHLVR